MVCSKLTAVIDSRIDQRGIHMIPNRPYSFATGGTTAPVLRQLSFGFLMFAAASIAPLHAVVIYDNFESTYGPAGYVRSGSPRFFSLNIGIAPMGFPFAGQMVAELRTEQDFVYPGNNAFKASSTRRELFPYQNSPDLPLENEALKKQRILDLIKGHLRRDYTPPKDEEHYLPNDDNIDGGGVRGSLDLFDLTEASPAWATFVDLPENAFPFVPFIVNSAGDGDTLSIYGNAGLLWNAPLAGLELGTLYFALLPEHTAPTMNFTSIWLNSKGQANASVSIAAAWDFAPEDYETTAVPDTGNTLRLVGISMFAVVAIRSLSPWRSGYRRRK